MPLKRVFIAINLPKEIKSAISEIIAQAKEKMLKAGIKDIKWVDPKILHFTLHFLGYLNEGQIEKVEQGIRETALNFCPSRLKLKSFGFFPRDTRPRVIFVEVEEIDSNHLLDLQRKLGVKLLEQEIAIDKRPFRLHITLGRIKEGTKINVENLNKIRVPALEWEVGSVELMESRLHRAGPEYSVARSFELGRLKSNRARLTH